MIGLSLGSLWKKRISCTKRSYRRGSSTQNGMEQIDKPCTQDIGNFEKHGASLKKE